MDAVTARQRFDRDGFIHLEGALSADEVAALTAAIEAAPERDPGDNPLSLGPMRFASNLFYGSEHLRGFLCSPLVVGLTTALLGPDAWVRWDQAVWKSPGAPTFPWHQDNGYSLLEAAHLQIWVALTPMRPDNGGLEVVVGGHRERLAHEWIGGHVYAAPPGETVPIVAAAGDVVAFSSFLPHATPPNTSATTRLAYVAELLALDDADRSVAPPHFVAVEGGVAAGRFEDLTPRWIDGGAAG